MPDIFLPQRKLAIANVLMLLGLAPLLLALLPRTHALDLLDRSRPLNACRD